MEPDKENRGGRFHTPPHRRPEKSPPKSSPRGSFPFDAARRETQPDNSSAAGNLLALGTSSFSGAASLAASAIGALSPRRALAQQQRSSDPGGLGGARPAAAGEEVPHPPPQGLRARPASSGNDPGPSENRPSSEAPTAPSSGLPSDMLNQVLQATTDALKSQCAALVDTWHVLAFRPPPPPPPCLPPARLWPLHGEPHGTRPRAAAPTRQCLCFAGSRRRIRAPARRRATTTTSPRRGRAVWTLYVSKRFGPCTYPHVNIILFEVLGCGRTPAKPAAKSVGGLARQS